MEILRIWFFVCLVFAFISLDKLIEESHELIYGKKNETEAVLYLICEKLSDVYPNQTEIDLTKLKDHLYSHFVNSLFNLKIEDPNTFYSSKLEEFVRNRTKSGGYLVLNRMACLIVNDRSELDDLARSLRDNAMLYFTIFAIEKGTFNFVQMDNFKSFEVNQLTVLKRGYPYFDCSQSARFYCLNECFKKKTRLARYFYDSNETGLIQLNFSDRNRSIEESERNCFRECKKENCKLVQLISIDKLENSKNETFEAKPKLGAFDYWVQLIGMICSFSGLSFNEFVSVTIEFIQSKVRKRKVQLVLFYLKFVIIFLGLAFFGYLCARVAFDSEENYLNSIERRHFINPKIVHLAICVQIKNFHKFYRDDLNGYKTMLWLERATDGLLNNSLKGIYLDYGQRSFRTDYHVQPKVLFKYFFRCFLLTIRLTYEVIPSDPKLIIEFEENFFHQEYILSENENLNSQSFQHLSRLGFLKRIVKRLRGCVNYTEKYGNCTSRWHCVDKCIVRRLKMDHKISLKGFSYNLIVDRDSFTPTEWSSTDLKKISTHHDSFQSSVDQCLQEIPPEEPCLEVKFEKTVEIDGINNRAVEIDLRFDVVQSVEVTRSPYKLLLDLVNIQSILFGFTVFSILQMITSFVQATLKLQKKKLVLFSIYLLCSFGASWHTYQIFNEVINGELVPTEHYKLAEKVQMPAMVFCLQIDKKLIDVNHQLTGNYLEQLTRQMTAESTFANISYLNESNEWIHFDRSQMERFFFLDKKCFKMKIDQVYGRDQFHFLANSSVLKVNFIETDETKTVFFMTKTEETAGLSKIIPLNSLNSYHIRRKFSISHETSVYKYKDRFSWIRRHFHSDQEESAGDLQRQLVALQGNEHNLRTLKLPLGEESFGLEVNEDLFEQLFFVKNQKNRNQPIISNYRQTFVTNHKRDEPLFVYGSDFTFRLVFLQKIVRSTNEETFSKLILSLLNLLFIWFDLGVLDMHLVLVHLYLQLSVRFFGKINQMMLSSCKWLKKHKTRLNQILWPPRSV